jgi:hypothetical protein
VARTRTSTDSAAPAIPLDPSYLSARRKLANREVGLDWPKLRRRSADGSPDTIRLYPARLAQSENARLADLAPQLRDRLFVIGTDGASLLFAIDKRGRVVVMDAVELAYPKLVAPDFDAFAAAFVTTRGAKKELERRDKDGALRHISRQWRRLDAIIEGRHALATADPNVILVDIANDYLLARRPDALQDALRAFVKRHPTRGKTLATKIRKYMRQWNA